MHRHGGQNRKEGKETGHPDDFRERKKGKKSKVTKTERGKRGKKSDRE